MALKQPLSGLEQKIMQVLWERGSGTAPDVQSGLLPGRALRDSTVRTVLGRLEEKGYVRHEVDGRTFVYQPVQRPQNLAVSAVRQIIDRLCHGSVESLLVGMVDDEVLDPEELKRIGERLAEERRGARGKRRAKK